LKALTRLQLATLLTPALIVVSQASASTAEERWASADRGEFAIVKAERSDSQGQVVCGIYVLRLPGDSIRRLPIPDSIRISRAENRQQSLKRLGQDGEWLYFLGQTTSTGIWGYNERTGDVVLLAPWVVDECTLTGDSVRGDPLLIRRRDYEFDAASESGSVYVLSEYSTTRASSQPRCSDTVRVVPSRFLNWADTRYRHGLGDWWEITSLRPGGQPAIVMQRLLRNPPFPGGSSEYGFAMSPRTAGWWVGQGKSGTVFDSVANHNFVPQLPVGYSWGPLSPSFSPDQNVLAAMVGGDSGEAIVCCDGPDFSKFRILCQVQNFNLLSIAWTAEGDWLVGNSHGTHVGEGTTPPFLLAIEVATGESVKLPYPGEWGQQKEKARPRRPR
jgi:hypothetical protein